MNRQVRKKKTPVRRAIWKHIYINLVEIDVMFSMFAAYWLGAQNYWLVALFIGISLTLGYVTSYLYWHLIDTSNGKEEKRKPRK